MCRGLRRPGRGPERTAPGVVVHRAVPGSEARDDYHLRTRQNRRTTRVSTAAVRGEVRPACPGGQAAGGSALPRAASTTPAGLRQGQVAERTTPGGLIPGVQSTIKK